MTVGLLFGTFNPVHNGHIQVAQSAMFNNVIEQVWFMVTPQSPFKKNMTLLAKEHRLEMVRLALDEYSHFQVSDFEFSLSYPQYTASTLKLIEKQYPDNNFIIIMGSDNYLSLLNGDWYKADYILNNFRIIIYPRDQKIIQPSPLLTVISSDLIELSSTSIRLSLSDSFDGINKLPLPPLVKEYIKTKNLYSSDSQ